MSSLHLQNKSQRDEGDESTDVGGDKAKRMRLIRSANGESPGGNGYDLRQTSLHQLIVEIHRVQRGQTFRNVLQVTADPAQGSVASHIKNDVLIYPWERFCAAFNIDLACGNSPHFQHPDGNAIPTYQKRDGLTDTPTAIRLTRRTGSQRL